MKVNTEQWQCLCSVLENRGYRYYDAMEDLNPASLDDDMKVEFKIFTNVQNRIASSKEGSYQRFSAEQKKYLLEMLDEYMTYNTKDGEEEYKLCGEISKLLEK